jgi:hypothetical protein
MPRPADSTAQAGRPARASFLAFLVLVLAAGFTWLLGSGGAREGAGARLGVAPSSRPGPDAARAAASPAPMARVASEAPASPDGPAPEARSAIPPAPPRAAAPPPQVLLVCRLDDSVPDPVPAWSAVAAPHAAASAAAPPPARAPAGQRALELRLPLGDWRVHAEAPGLYGPSQVARADRDAAGEERRVELTLALVAAAPVAGRVLTAGGEPAAGIEARAIDADGATLASAHADGDGFFLLDDVPCGAARLELGAQGFPLAAAHPFEVLRPRVELEPLVLPPACTVAALVVDEAGLPVAGARVRSPADPRGAGQALLTDDRGRALLSDLPAGPGRVFAEHGALGRGNTAARFVPGEELLVEVVLRTRRP